MSAARELFLGRFVKAFGIKGELKLYASDDFWFDALSSQRLFSMRDGGVDKKAVDIEYAQPHQKQFIVKLEGINQRNAAEREVGANLFLDMQELDVPLPEHELPFQVLGMRVRTEDGRDLGHITDVLVSPGQNVYEVTGEAGKVLIPAVDAFIIARDFEGGEMTVRPIPGLLDDPRRREG
jgi:16S rRNA processing protein RimM